MAELSTIATEIRRSDVEGKTKNFSIHSLQGFDAEVEPAFINKEWSRIINICEHHPHSKVIANKYLQIIQDIASGGLNARIFPANIDIVETIYEKVSLYPCISEFTP
jgi:hypothetical protein